MMKYGDDQCEECGGIRVARSKLCVDCLVKERDILGKEVLIKMTVIEVKKKRITCLQGLLKEAMAYGFKQNQENAKLETRIKRMSNIALRRIPDEKNG
jgi:uncharacterized OB-fold protein